MSKEELAQILNILRSELSRVLGDQLEAVYLYGSRARGDALPDSDVDILIVIRGDFDYFSLLERTSVLITDLSLQYDVVISRSFVSKEQYDHTQTPFLMNIRREGILV